MGETGEQAPAKGAKKIGIIKKHRARRRRSKAAKRSKPDYPRVSFRSIFYVMKIYRRAVGPKRFFMIAYRVYTAILPSVAAIISGMAVTQVAESIESHDFVRPIITIAILLAIQLVDVFLRELNNLISVSVYQEVYAYVSERVALKYIEIPLAMRESQSFADKFERVRDFGGSITSVTYSLLNIATSFISLISIVIATLTISPFVTLFVALAAVPYSILSLKLAAKRRRNWRKFTRDRRIAWDIERKITNSNSALEIEINNLQRHLVDRMVKERRRSQEQDVADTRSFFWPHIGSSTLENVTSYGVLAVIAKKIIDGDLAIGQFITVRPLLSQLNSSIYSLFDSIADANDNLVNATDFMEFMNTPNRASGDIMVQGTPRIEFRDVTFTYPHAQKPALEHVSFVLEPGQSVAIVGENGAGKTTLIKLMIGAYSPDSGVILINGQPLDKIHRDSYLAQIGALFQDYTRYEFATLGENVWYGDVSRQYKEDEIVAALTDAGLGSLPNKYPTGLKQILSKDLSENHATDLSGGQWQRIGIARAFYRAANVLILDEPTSAVDAKSEYEIFRNILRKQQNRSTIIISHRFSTVRKAKNIIVLDSGKIVERGTHEELMAQNGVYREMFELQAEGYV